ncbi:hypothetical protein ACFWG6_22925 [Streptomyces erythrochromogenes]|uniref:hypothetical protein n=1 Tax=Streptomyces erythrochromogenes TaxID=285574 RepID=UPI00363BEEE3
MRRRELHDAAAGVTGPRLLPWTTQDGNPCYLSTDGGGHLSSLADSIEEVQLDMGEEFLGCARQVVAPGAKAGRVGGPPRALAAGAVASLLVTGGVDAGRLQVGKRLLGLVVHHGPDVWRSDPADRWPAVCVGSEGVYAVVSDAWSNDAEVLFETVDPVLVAVEWGKLIGVRQGSG